MTKEEASDKIEKALMQGGQYTHNMCGIVLGQVMKTEGVEVANDLIKEFALDDLFGIRPVKPVPSRPAGEESAGGRD